MQLTYGGERHFSCVWAICGFALAALTLASSVMAQIPEERSPCACDEARLADFDKNPDVPDIVERWAPVIYQDTDADRVWADLITSVNFDGNWQGADNATNAAKKEKRELLRAVVYFSMVRTATHTFLGYYFYHAHSSNGWPHEHDLEGVVVAVSRSSGQIEAMLTNVHGPYVPYVAPWDVRRIQIKKQNKEYRDLPDFTLLRQSPKSSGLPYAYDALAVGIEANTHAVWGRWNNKCVVGPTGSPSGCDDSHGGDGVVYVYKNKAEVPGSFKRFPNWMEYGYQLRDIKELWIKAQDPAYCGDKEPTAIFSRSVVPCVKFNGLGKDEGDLPWVWGTNQVIDRVCGNEPNVLLNPAAIFQAWFEFPANTFSNTYVFQPYVMSTPCQ